MIPIRERIAAFSGLGRILTDYQKNVLSGHEAEILQSALIRTEQENPWFTREAKQKCMMEWASALTEENISRWISPYLEELERERPVRSVGVIMAGNIPMAGFHDALCVLMSGNRLVAKLSAQDAVLIPVILNFLSESDPRWKELISLTTGKIGAIDAVIATGSNNSARYFNFYFGKYPHIIRKNRNSIAILDGNETEKSLRSLSADIFTYFGLGCRCVSKIYIPESYDVSRLVGACGAWQHVFHHHKYRNNLDYFRSIYLINRTPFIDGGFFMLLENPAFSSPVSVLHYERYSDRERMISTIRDNIDELQCVVSHTNPGIHCVLPGETQSPALWDYADNADTMSFLLDL